MFKVSVTIVRIRITLFWCLWWQVTVIEVKFHSKFLIYILYYVNDIILVFQVKITIITVTFGVTTPSVATTPTTVVTRAPRGIHYYLIKCRSNSITAIMRKGWFNVLCFDNAGFNFQPPRCRSQADAAKPYEASCSHWQWSNSVTLFVVSVWSNSVTLAVASVWPFIYI